MIPIGYRLSAAGYRLWAPGSRLQAPGSRFRAPGIALFAVLLWTVVAAAAPVPARIISLVPSVTETLFAIGAGPQVIAVSSFDHHPPEVERLPRVGALVDPDVERILALRPDLVFTYHSQEDLGRQLARAGIATYPFVHGGLEASLASIVDVGRRVGHAAEAEALVQRISARLDRVRTGAAGRPRPRVLLVFGREPGSLRGLYASGGIGFLHDLVQTAGGDNVFADVRRESVQATTELVIARRPDVIVEIRPEPVGDAAAVARETSAWDALGSVPAVRDKRIVWLTGTDLVIPGPRLADAAERLARAIRP
jgi:iron complex transport system substrate-binding protein